MRKENKSVYANQLCSLDVTTNIRVLRNRQVAVNQQSKSTCVVDLQSF